MNLIEIYYDKNVLHRHRYGEVVYECIDVNEMKEQLLYKLKYKANADSIRLLNDATGYYREGWQISSSVNHLFFTSAFVKAFEKNPVGRLIVSYTPYK